MSELKVFRIDVDGETEWVSTNDEFGILDWYLDETDFDESDIESIKEVPKEQWESISIKYDEDDDDGNPIISNVAEFMETVSRENHIICSTAY